MHVVAKQRAASRWQSHRIRLSRFAKIVDVDPVIRNRCLCRGFSKQAIDQPVSPAAVISEYEEVVTRSFDGESKTDRIGCPVLSEHAVEVRQTGSGIKTEISLVTWLIQSGMLERCDRIFRHY